MSVEDITSSENLPIWMPKIRQLTDDSTIIKVKIYAPNGNTVYSSEFSQIGDDKSDNSGFLTALGGGVASELVYKDTFNAF